MADTQNEKVTKDGGYAEEDQNIYPPYHGMSPARYLATRVSSLKPPMAKAPNPIKLIRMLTRQQWAFFAIAFLAWVRLPRPCLFGLQFNALFTSGYET